MLILLGTVPDYPYWHELSVGKEAITMPDCPSSHELSMGKGAIISTYETPMQ